MVCLFKCNLILVFLLPVTDPDADVRDGTCSAQCHLPQSQHHCACHKMPPTQPPKQPLTANPSANPSAEGADTPSSSLSCTEQTKSKFPIHLP